MRKPVWIPKIDQVLGVKSERRTLTSKKGTEYETDVIPQYSCVAIGTPTEKHNEDGSVSGYSYEVYVPSQDLGGFAITAPEKLDFKGMASVTFYGLRGGALNLPGRSEGWFKADRVELAKE